MSKKAIEVTLNTLDEEGSILDTTSMELSGTSVSDIVDHAAQLVIVARKSDKIAGAVGQVFDELEEALQVAGVL